MFEERQKAVLKQIVEALALPPEKALWTIHKALDNYVNERHDHALTAKVTIHKIWKLAEAAQRNLHWCADKDSMDDRSGPAVGESNASFGSAM